MIEPLNDNILIKLPKEEEGEQTTSFGLVVPTQATSEESRKNRGMIEALGSKVEGLKVGETVLYEKWGGTVFEFEDNKFILINAKSILAKIT